MHAHWENEIYQPPRPYIEETPHFEDLYKIRQATEQVINGIIALADGGDTVQRATDLHNQIHELKALAEQILLQEN